MKTNMLHDDLLDRMRRLDEDASLIYDDSTGKRFNCIIVGGSALILLSCINRATHDIDVVYCSKEICGLLEKYDFNQRVQVYLSNFPYNFEDRFVKVNVETKIIDFYTASLEDIVISKLCSFRDTDYNDITQPYVVGKIDWDLLERLAEELKDSILNERNYAEFKTMYEKYAEDYKK